MNQQAPVTQILAELQVHILPLSLLCGPGVPPTPRMLSNKPYVFKDSWWLSLRCIL